MADTLDRIAASGNRGRNPNGPRTINNRIVCADGYRLSVLAEPGAKCTPRPELFPGVPCLDGQPAPHDYPGPYTAVEVLLDGAAPEGWARWLDDPDDVSHSFVPVAEVRALIDAHGGEDPAALNTPEETA